MSDIIIETYEDVCQFVKQQGILPLSGFIPEYPSLVAITRPESWHTGSETDPWLWRDRLAGDGIAAYGRFIAGKPLFISREIFPLVQCASGPAESIEERYAAGVLARETVRIYELIAENAGIDVKALRKLAGLQHMSAKNVFDHALLDLQNTLEIVISGISGKLNAQGNKSGWNSTCYILTEHWMEQYGLEALNISSIDAKAQLLIWLEERCHASAIQYIRKKMGLWIPVNG